MGEAIKQLKTAKTARKASIKQINIKNKADHKLKEKTLKERKKENDAYVNKHKQAVQTSTRVVKQWVEAIFKNLQSVVLLPVQSFQEKAIKRQFEFDKKWGNNSF